MDESLSKVDGSQVIDLHFRDITTNALGSIERIYRHFDIEFDDHAREAWQHRIDADPRADHGDGKVHSLEDFELTEEAINDVLGGYYERYLQVENGYLASISK